MASQQMDTNIAARAWTKKNLPKKILVIRLQAIGDVTITLPYVQYLRNKLPVSTKIDFLTRKECAEIPKGILLFNKVISIGGGRNLENQLLHVFFLLPKLLWQRYDVVIDLQNNILSRLIRKAIWPKAWSAFDRFSPDAAGERTRMTIQAIGLGNNSINSDFRFKNHFDFFKLLRNNGWDGKSKLIVLNPAGAFPTRHWPLKNYISFVELWLHRFPHSQFLILGTSLIESTAAYLKGRLGEKLISLINKTTVAEAFAIIQHVKFVLSEDSGLMHMAWVSGVPTMALFGSTRSDWSRPLGKHSFFLDSSDLSCGNCMREVCKWGDNRCMTRYTAEFVFEKAMELMERKTVDESVIVIDK